MFTKKIGSGIVLLILLCTACADKKKSNTLFGDSYYFNTAVKELNQVILENNFPPVIASRNYAYATIAAYECIAYNNPQYRSLANQLRGFKPLPAIDTAGVNYNLAALLSFIKVGNNVTFPEGSLLAKYDALLKTAHSLGMPSYNITQTQQFAEAVVAHIMQYSKADNYAQTRSASKYPVRDEDGRWVPTPPAYAQALEPHWQEIRTLVLDSASIFKPKPTLAFNIKNKSSAYYKEVMYLKQATGDSLTEDRKHMAAFWDDLNTKLNVVGHVQFLTKKFSPPGHWMNIVAIATQKSHADLPTTIYAYTLTAISIFDAFIQCWDEKYRSNMPRPETIINKFIDPNWHPYLQSPPFPEYTCGHSTISAAAATALTHVFGDHFSYIDSSEMPFGIPPRSFTSFNAAAEENLWARFYGGIHFHYSCVAGNIGGKQVGNYILQTLSFKK